MSDVRGIGLIYGIEMQVGARPAEPPSVLGSDVVEELRRQGILTFVLHPGNVLFVCPPLIITTAQVRELAAAIKLGLDAVAAARGLDGIG